MRVPLEVAAGPTCTPHGVCPIRAHFTFKSATSGLGVPFFLASTAAIPRSMVAGQGIGQRW